MRQAGLYVHGLIILRLTCGYSFCMRVVIVITVLALLLPILGAPGTATAQDFQVVDGEPAAEGAYPAMAAVLFEGIQHCGGTLVDDQWVLTAAHCFYDPRIDGSGIPPEALSVVVDTINWAQGGERIPVDRVVLHPDYDDLNTVNDIAMLRLVNPATTDPAAMVGSQEAALYAPGRPAVVTGFGATTPLGDERSAVLLQADLPLISDADCGVDYDNLVADRHVCAGQPGSETDPGPDTCQGDSGGPLWTDRDDGTPVVIGITSFGALCGVDSPGVYTQVITYLQWAQGLIDGAIDPGAPVDPTTADLPDDATAPPVRITFEDAAETDPALQAVAISRQTFQDGNASFGVIATGDRFPDALAGSTLAYGVAPLLFTGPDGLLGEEAAEELQRVVAAGSGIYVLGGTAALPAALDAQLVQMGYGVIRLAGSGREATAVRVAEQVVQTDRRLPLGTVIVATSGNWPDAVAVGQIGAWWGVPILLTPVDGLNENTAQALTRIRPATVLVAGGTEAVSQQVMTQIREASPGADVTRLGGASRFDTSVSVTDYNLDLYGATAPSYIVAVNLRREPDGYAHVLAASMLAGGFASVFASVEGAAGDSVSPQVRNSVCGLDLPVLVAGGTDLISNDVVESLRTASAGQRCDPDGVLQVGDATNSAITSVLPTRSFQFTGQEGQRIRFRMDAAPGEGEELDPFVEVSSQDGAFVARNDDSPEPAAGLNSLLITTLPADGTYTVTATTTSPATGRFLLSVDPAPIVTHEDVLTAAEPERLVTASPPPGTRVVIEMRSTDGHSDPLLTVLDEAGEQIATDDDGGGSPHARVTFETPPFGGVRIIAGAFGDDFGAYSLAISLIEGSADSGDFSVE